MVSCSRNLIPKGDPTFVSEMSLKSMLPVIDSPPVRNYDIAADLARIRMRPEFLLDGRTSRAGMT